VEKIESQAIRSLEEVKITKKEQASLTGSRQERIACKRIENRFNTEEANSDDLV